MLKADRIGKPKTAALDGAGESETRIPVAEVDALLNVDAGRGIGGTEAPAVVAIGSFEAKNVCTGVGVTRAEISCLDFGSARGVYVEARGELAINRVADFETIEQVLGFFRARAGNVETAEIVLGDFGQSGEALREDVRAGDGNVPDVAGSECVALGGVLRIDLIGGGGDLDLLVNLFRVVQSQRDFVEAGLKSESAANDHEEAFLADFEFVIAWREISKSEAAGSVGFCSVDVSSAVFQFQLSSADGDTVFIQHKAGTAGQIRRAS